MRTPSSLQSGEQSLEASRVVEEEGGQGVWESLSEPKCEKKNALGFGRKKSSSGVEVWVRS